MAEPTDTHATAPALVRHFDRFPGVRLAWRERWWLVAFAAVLMLCRIPTVDGWDEAFYVGQLTSALGDGDLRLQDDVVLVPKPFEEKCRVITTVLPSGALANTFSVGPAILLSPFALPVVSAGVPPPAMAFRAAAAFGAMSMLVLTALVSARVVRRFGVAPDTACLAAGLALLSSPLAVYGTRSYLNAHAFGALLVVAVVHQALAWVDSRSPKNAVALGLAAGLACANRWQDAVVVLPILLFAVVAAARSARPWRSGTVFVMGAASLALTCQLVAWWIQFGTPFLIPQGSGYMRWTAPAIIPLVLSSYHGLVPWAPGLALGLLALGLGLWRASHRWLLGALALGSLLALYVSACPQDWWGRDSFGPRRLASLAPVAAIGIGVVFQRISGRMRALMILVLGAWATFAMSAHFSSHDDLLLLLTGRGDPFRPAEATAVAGAHWVNSWGPLHALKPGFSLSDAPRLADRVIGIAFVTSVVALMRLVWPLLAQRKAAQGLAVGLAAAHIGAWLLLLALAPSNRSWNTQWKTFLASPLEVSEAVSLPREMAVARDVVLVARAVRSERPGTLSRALDRLDARGIPATAADAARCRTLQ